METLLIVIVILIVLIRVLRPNSTEAQNTQPDKYYVGNNSPKILLPEDIAPIPVSDFSKVENLVLHDEADKIRLQPLSRKLTDLFFGDANEKEMIEAMANHKELLEELITEIRTKERLAKMLQDPTVSMDQIFMVMSSVVDLVSIERRINEIFDKGWITLPDHLAIKNIAMTMDGGSKVFICQNVDTQEEITLAFQHYHTTIPNRNLLSLTGAIYYDSCLVPIRSDFEKRLIEKIKEAVGLNKANALADINFSIESSPSALMNRHIPKALLIKRYAYEAVSFVESEDYVQWAKVLGRIEE